MQTPDAIPTLPSNPTNPGENLSKKATEGGPDASTAPQAEGEKKPEDIASRIQEHAKRAKEILKRNRETKQKQQLEADKDAKLKQWQELQERAKKSPIEALMAHGYSYEDATNFVLQSNNSPFTPDEKIQSLDKKFQEFQKSQEERERQKAADEQKRIEAEAQEVIQEYKREVSEYIAANPDKFELCSMYQVQATELVYETVQSYFTTHQKVLSNEEATGLVEAYLEAEAEKISKSKKISSKFQPRAEGDRGSPSPSGSKTLNNSMTSSAVPSLLPAATESDRIKRALAKLGA